MGLSAFRGGGESVVRWLLIDGGVVLESSSSEVSSEERPVCIMYSPKRLVIEATRFGGTLEGESQSGSVTSPLVSSGFGAMASIVLPSKAASLLSDIIPVRPIRTFSSYN
jgi:hypothetical protein